MIRYLPMLVGLLKWGIAPACSCSTPPLTEVIFRQFSYVARVKVTSFKPFTRDSAFVNREYGTQTAVFTCTTLENFGPELPKEILMSSYRTSCDIGLREGEEWLIFVKKDKGYSIVHPCSYSQQLANKNNERRSYRYDRTNDFLNQLRTWSNRPLVIKDGRVEEAYANGQKALSELYQQGILVGERQAWYPNGQLRGKETYVKGKLDGEARWYYPDGKIESKSVYQDGRRVGTWQTWSGTQDTLSARLFGSLYRISVDSARSALTKRRLSDSTVYDPVDETVLYQLQYDQLGSRRAETTRMGDLTQTTRYLEGKLGTVTVSRVKTWQPVFDINWRGDGTQTVFYYDSKGRQTKVVQVATGRETVLRTWTYPD